MNAVAADADQRAEEGIEKQGQRPRRVDGRGGAPGRRRPAAAEEQAADEGRGAGRKRHRQEGADADLGHHQFDGEHHAADRRVEGGGDAGPGPGRDQRDALPRRHAHDLAQVEPRAAPIWMIGPSRPTAAPVPIASAEASDFTTATTGRIMPFL